MIFDDPKKAFEEGVKEGMETGKGRDTMFDMFPFPDFTGVIEARQSGRDVGAAIKRSKD
jgi:hypothetical protein